MLVRIRFKDGRMIRQSPYAAHRYVMSGQAEITKESEATYREWLESTHKGPVKRRRKKGADNAGTVT